MSTQADVIKVAIHQKGVESYQQLAVNQRCNEIDNFSFLKGQVSNLFFTLICQALARSQFEAQWQVVSAPNYRRAIWLVVKGDADIAATIYMANQYIEPALESGAIALSIPIIRGGEQAMAFYALPSNEKAMSVTSAEELRQVKAALPPSWRNANTILQNKLKVEVESVKYELLFEFLQSGRADFTALRLQGDRETDYAVTHNGITLKPIWGLKVTLDEPSYYIVGRKQPHSEAFYQALQQGLRQLRQDGTLVKALRQAGVLNDNPDDWTSIYNVAPSRGH